MIYLDNAATTKVLSSVKDVAIAAMVEDYGNPAAIHSFGKRAKDIIEDSRNIILQSLGKKGKVIFTSGGTESINWAILFGANKNKHKGKHIISTEIEHAATLETLKHLKGEGYDITLIKPEKNGDVMAQKVIDAIREDTILISVMAVCNETGAIIDFDKIAKCAKNIKKDILVHVDGVQGFLKVPLNTQNIDMLSISAHKIGGIKGIGALYIKEDLKITPWLYGGYQDLGLRSGTQAVPQIAAFGQAVKTHLEKHQQDVDKMIELRDIIVERLEKIGGIVVKPSNYAPHIVNVGFKKGRSEVLIRVLSDKGIYIAGGSACSKGAKSHVLLAMGLESKIIDSSLRISLTEENTKEEIDILIAELESALKMFR